MNKIALFSLLIAPSAHNLYCAEQQPNNNLINRKLVINRFQNIFGWRTEKAKELISDWHARATTPQDKEILKELAAEGPDVYLNDQIAQLFASKIEDAYLEFPPQSSAAVKAEIIATQVNTKLPALLKQEADKIPEGTNRTKLAFQVKCLLTAFCEYDGDCATI